MLPWRAHRLRARFSRGGGHQVAVTEWRGESLHLIKPACFMNVSGPAVARLGRRLHLGPSDLIIVFDDLDLPLGTVRVRMKGSAGGHNGVRSVIEALGTDAVRRVKVGTGRAVEVRALQDRHEALPMPCLWLLGPSVVERPHSGAISPPRGLNRRDVHRRRRGHKEGDASAERHEW